MKVAIVLFLAIAVLTAEARITDEQKQKLKGFYTDCVTSSGVDEALIKKARKAEFSEDGNLVKYYGCMLRKMGIMDADGTLHSQKLIDSLPETVDQVKGKEVINKCTSEQTGGTPDLIAYNCYKCFVTSIGEVKFF